MELMISNSPTLQKTAYKASVSLSAVIIENAACSIEVEAENYPSITLAGNVASRRTEIIVTVGS
jgi:hypothetical protein